MVIGGPTVASVADLRGKRVGVEVGFVDHLLLLKALEANGMTEADVELVNMATNELPQALATGAVEAIAAWQPNSGQALKTVAGSKPLYTSADQPGLIYDLLYASRESVETRREDWQNVVRTWYDVVDFFQDPANRDEAVRILSARVGLTAEEYAPLLDGTYILSLDEAIGVMTGGAEAGLGSLSGSTAAVDDFNVGYEVYGAPEAGPEYLDATLASALAAEREALAAAE
jgi:NitT/TauT family transport system substrate-binding protein